MLLPALHALHERAGHISHSGLDYICVRLSVPPAEAYGVASAYALFGLENQAGTVIHICDDIACRSVAGRDPCRDMDQVLGPEDTVQDGVSWSRSPCLGQCEKGSAALLQISGPEPARVSIAPFAADNLPSAMKGSRLSEPDRAETIVPQISNDRSNLRLLRRVGLVDPESLDSYRSAGGYESLRHGLEMGPDRIIGEVKTAGLVGRGGAAFPTATKWRAVATNETLPHYLLCNADESEPGTFKDRILIEHDPFALAEAITIGAYATGSEGGYIYIRGEYPLGERRLREAIDQAYAQSLLGANIMGRGFNFDLEVRRGAGAYIAGEETALFNSIEGKRPEPRNKPPFPTDSGLFGKPTVVNNVETLFNVLEIMRVGGDSFARIGTTQSTGTRLLCLSGCVARPGLYEAPQGITIRDALNLAGGIRSGNQLQAVLLGGAAGSFIGTDQLDLPLSSEGLKEAGLTLGSGVIMAFGQTVDMADIVKRIARFFRDESCGQCVPCRVGTVRQEELVTRLEAGGLGRAPQHELAVIEDLAAVMRDASICGLGQTASNAVMSAIRLGMLPSTERSP